MGHVQFDRLATINGFQIRTGGLCNVGVVARVMGLSDGEILEGYETGRACWDEGELAQAHTRPETDELTAAEEFGGADGTKPLGIARISFGTASTVGDVDAFVAFIRRFYIALPKVDPPLSPVDPSSWTATLETLMLCMSLTFTVSPID